MSTNTAFERLLASVMADAAIDGDPEQAIERILTTTGRIRPLPRWLVLLKEPPMRISERVATGSPTLRRVAVLLVAVLLILAVAAGIAGGSSLLRSQTPTLPAPFGLARNGSLVYAAVGDIFVADPTGATTSAIVTGPEHDSDPAFSHDGTRFAFLRATSTTTQVMVAHSDGTDVRPLTAVLDQIDRYDWSPDDRQLVIHHVIAGKPSISIVAADGSETIRTLDLGVIQPVDWVAWRPPVARDLIFRGYPDASGAVALYSILPDGTGLHAISTAVTPDPVGTPTLSEPEMSPDGKTMSYWTWAPAAPGGGNGFTRVLDLTSGQERVADAYGGSISVFSPDGKWIVGQGDGQLMIEPADRSSTARTLGPKFGLTAGQQFAFSPDGTKVYLTLDTPAETLIIDVASDQSVTTKQPIPNLPTTQRLAP